MEQEQSCGPIKSRLTSLVKVLVPHSFYYSRLAPMQYLQELRADLVLLSDTSPKYQSKMVLFLYFWRYVSKAKHTPFAFSRLPTHRGNQEMYTYFQKEWERKKFLFLFDSHSFLEDWAAFNTS
ncbi:hypothetical protein CEXT_43451 [Caerostris extrusa]|uniref:Maturase K n=1 Tax=Caerostris extrusa TaxID=172846 RepID=A0AAV4N3M3_CAEEX|nr:hypothetical protein CEXT_43451 [Caerostris extrusa]